MKTAVIGNTQTIVNTIAKLLLNITDCTERIWMFYLRKYNESTGLPRALMNCFKDTII